MDSRRAMSRRSAGKSSGPREIRVEENLPAILGSIPVLAKVPLASWRIQPLPGLTNRSFRLTSGEGGVDIALRVAGAGTGGYISRAAELANAAAAAARGLAPPYIHGDPVTGTLVTAFIGDARALVPHDLQSHALLSEAARLLGRLHSCGAAFVGEIEPFAAIDRYLALADDERLRRLRDAAGSLRPELRALAEAVRPCHVDPSPGNFLWSQRQGLLLIDWEYSAMADPVWDLAVLAIEARLDRDQEEAMLRAYDGPVDTRRRRKLDLLKLLVRLVAAAWANAAAASGNAAGGLAETRARHVEALEREWPSSHPR